MEADDALTFGRELVEQGLVHRPGTSGGPLEGARSHLTQPEVELSGGDQKEARQRGGKTESEPQRGAGDCLSGLVGVLGAAGSDPLVSGAAAPPGVAGGTLPCTRGRSVVVLGGDVPVAGPVAGVSVAPGAREVGGLVLL